MLVVKVVKLECSSDLPVVWITISESFCERITGDLQLRYLIKKIKIENKKYCLKKNLIKGLFAPSVSVSVDA